MRPASNAYTPWSFVLPIALGVLLGSLLADLVRFGFAALAVREATVVLEQELERVQQENKALAETVIQRPPAPVPLPVYPHPVATAPLGSLACSGGAILQRIENGWAQVGRRSAGAQCRTAAAP